MSKRSDAKKVAAILGGEEDVVVGGAKVGSVWRDGDVWRHRVDIGEGTFATGQAETKAAARRACRILAGDALDFQRRGQPAK